jgi:hypothetical protein
MSITVFDFSRQAAAKGKFVVLRKTKGAGDGIVLFSDFSQDSQHVDILRRWERTHSTSLAAAGMVTAGGGWWKRIGTTTIVLYGSSAAFGRFDRAWLRERLTPADVPSVSEILIEDE